ASAPPRDRWKLAGRYPCPLSPVTFWRGRRRRRPKPPEPGRGEPMPKHEIFDVIQKADIFDVGRPLIGTTMPAATPAGGPGLMGQIDQAGSTLKATATSQTDLAKIQKSK